jgi:hypothetical protein
MNKKSNIAKKALNHLKKNWIKYGFETLVVIIGILLALALNNWNENRLQDIKEIQYLNRLVKDIQADTIYYNERVSSSEFVINYHRNFIRTMYQTQQTFKEVEDLFSPLTWNSQHLTTQNATYIELTSSGNLDILSNSDLKETIIQYYRKNEEVGKHIAEFNEFSTRKLTDLSQVIRNATKFYNTSNDIYEKIDFYEDKDWGFMNEPNSVKFQALEHTLSLYRLKHQQFLEHFKTLKYMATQLMVDIKKELNSRN